MPELSIVDPSTYDSIPLLQVNSTTITNIMAPLFQSLGRLAILGLTLIATGMSQPRPPNNQQLNPKDPMH